MSGPICKDIFARSITIKGKTVIDTNRNATFATIKSTGGLQLNGKITGTEGACITGNLDVAGCINVTNGNVKGASIFDCNGAKVVGKQQAPVSNASPTSLNSLADTANTIIGVLRAHGLIANYI